ncbi:hypothetical protein GCM10009777_35170 [Microbacterium pumilum]|uniref:DUF4345 domain-containing protein n=1 Tax=Microbacterium pumilum TaxID=344165 RepID=A0ABP5ECZ9_9MICO
MVVTIAVVLVYLTGAVGALIGVLILLSRYQVDRASVLPVSLLGAGIILFALLTFAVASGLSRGSTLARLLVTLYLGAEFVLNVIAIASTDSWDWVATIQVVAEAFVVFALWAPPGRKHFAPQPGQPVATASARP